MFSLNNQPKVTKHQINGKIITLITVNSKKTIIGKKKKDNIYLFTQFYIPDNKERYDEIKETLKYNVENQLITNIILINERKYTEEEMGIADDKIIQIIKGKRMSFIDVFKNIKQLNGKQLNGYIIVSNSDIFFNKTLENIFSSHLMDTKKVFSLLRSEYDKNGTKLYGDYKISADTWIFHTKQLGEININDFDLTMGVGGVDNILPYKFHKNGFKIFNEPLFVQTLHNHHNDYRTWEKKKLFDNEFIYLSCIPNLRNN
jgi:hypothetical protein